MLSQVPVSSARTGTRTQETHFIRAVAMAHLDVWTGNFRPPLILFMIRDAAARLLLLIQQLNNTILV